MDKNRVCGEPRFQASLLGSLPKRHKGRGEAGLKSNAVPVAGGFLVGRRSDLAAEWRLAAAAEVAGQRRRGVHGGEGRHVRHAALLRAATDCLRGRLADRGDARAARAGRRQDALRIPARAVRQRRARRPCSRPDRFRRSRRSTRCVRPISRRRGAVRSRATTPAASTPYFFHLVGPSCSASATGQRPRQTGDTQVSQQRAIPAELWQGEIGDLLGQLGMNPDDEANLVPTKSWSMRASSATVRRLEAKLAEINRDIERQTAGGRVRPYYLFGEPCWNGELGAFLMMRLPVLPIRRLERGVPARG